MIPFLPDSEKRGTVQFRQNFLEHETWAGEVKKTNQGAIISTAARITTGDALRDVQDKGRLFIGINHPKYKGQVIGEHDLETDIEMNPCKAK